jgi:CRISPR/Cas system type I-B associated protein Csh2 (Cas7 group RAMP superfamily)
LKAAVAKSDACMKKSAPKLQSEHMKTRNAAKKALLKIAFSNDTPSAKSEKLRALVEELKEHSSELEQYTAALLQSCMSEVAAALQELSKLVRATCSTETCLERSEYTPFQNNGTGYPRRHASKVM